LSHRINQLISRLNYGIGRCHTGVILDHLGFRFDAEDVIKEVQAEEGREGEAEFDNLRLIKILPQVGKHGIGFRGVVLRHHGGKAHRRSLARRKDLTVDIVYVRQFCFGHALMPRHGIADMGSIGARIEMRTAQAQQFFECRIDA